MKIKVSKSFEKTLLKYPSKIQQKIIAAIDALPEGDIKKIKGKQTSPLTYRLRIGKYRVLLRMDSHTIFIDKLDTRGDIYK